MQESLNWIQFDIYGQKWSGSILQFKFNYIASDVREA